MNERGRLLGWALAPVLILVLGPLVVPFFVPWTGINCRLQEIDITTGQVRSSRKLWYITLSERIDETVLSRALQGEVVGSSGRLPAWQPVTTFSPGVRHSPHHRFHSALRQVAYLDHLASYEGLDHDQTRRIARAILLAWQEAGGDHGADGLIEHLLAEEMPEP